MVLICWVFPESLDFKLWPNTYFLRGSVSLLGLPGRHITGQRASTADITSHHPGGWSSKIKVSAGLVFQRALSLACIWIFSMSPPMAFLLCAHISGVFTSSYKETSTLEVGPQPQGSTVLVRILQRRKLP